MVRAKAQTESPAGRKDKSVITTHHPPHITQAHRWILAALLSGAGWTLLLAATMTETGLPLAAWGAFLWIAASNVIVWATVEHVMHRERMQAEHLAAVIAEAMANEGLVGRLPKQQR